MGNVVKWAVLGGLAFLPIAAKLVDEVISVAPVIPKGLDDAVQYTNPKKAHPKPSKPPKLDDQIIKDLRSEPAVVKPLDDILSENSDYYKALWEARKCISGVKDCSTNFGPPPSLFEGPNIPDLFPIPNISSCGSVELRHKLRKELKELSQSDGFNAYAESKAHEKVSDIFTKKIISQNPVSVQAKFLEEKLVLSIELPCGFENISVDL